MALKHDTPNLLVCGKLQCGSGGREEVVDAHDDMKVEADEDTDEHELQ